MNHWGILTQPLLKVFAVSPKRQVVPVQLKDHLSFIYVKEKFLWGIAEERVTPVRKVRISNSGVEHL